MNINKKYSKDKFETELIYLENLGGHQCHQHLHFPIKVKSTDPLAIIKEVKDNLVLELNKDGESHGFVFRTGEIISHTNSPLTSFKSLKEISIDIHYLEPIDYKITDEIDYKITEEQEQEYFDAVDQVEKELDERTFTGKEYDKIYKKYRKLKRCLESVHRYFSNDTNGYKLLIEHVLKEIKNV